MGVCFVAEQVVHLEKPEHVSVRVLWGPRIYIYIYIFMGTGQNSRSSFQYINLPEVAQNPEPQFQA